MEKKKILVVGLIGLLLAAGLYLITCTDNKCDGDCVYWAHLADNNEHKEIICDPYGNGGACFNSCAAYQRGGDALFKFVPIYCDCK
jgi:trehalose utilization protein